MTAHLDTTSRFTRFRRALSPAEWMALGGVAGFISLPLPLGVAGHEGFTVIVGLNGLRLRRARAWRHAAHGGRR
jgi:hypothetical protein